MQSNRRSKVVLSITAPFRDQVVSSMDVAHIMEHKIHSDLNKLASDLRKQEDPDVLEEHSSAPLQDQSVGVPGLEHRILPWFSRPEEHEDSQTTLDSECPQPEESCGIQWSPHEIGRGLPWKPIGHNDGSIERGSLRRCPAFGRRPRRHSFHNSKTHSAATESQSSLSQAISCSPSPSYSSKSGTPEHYRRCRPFYPYGPYTPGKSSNDINTERLHSPHTFGIPTPTPPQSRSSSSSRGETDFHFKTIPPPMPPLDHPVFRERVDEFGVLSTKQHLFSVTDKVARHAQSLPSIGHATHSIGSVRQQKSRKRSQSDVDFNTEGQKNNTRVEFVRKAFHSSRASTVSTRRSSAEYSAKQAASMDHGGCWEVDVSKAIISLSLKEQHAGSITTSNANPMSGSAPGKIAFQGQTCGYNEPSSQRAISLGSPFFLHADPLPRNLIGNPLYNDHSKTVKTINRIREPEIKHVARDERIKMSLGPVTTITIPSSHPSTSGIPKQTSSGNAAPSLEKKPSRRTGRTRQGERAGDTSSLVVPQLTIIGPTPEASPSSATTPTRRIHHKSTPTMPPKSILPPVIEKSYSSGSVKRKADEAGVEGDKTPPKETKEYKATFAPDPRTNRLSSHSIGHAPSSYNWSKRVRLTNASEGGRSTMSHPSSLEESSGPPDAKNTGSWSSRGSHGPRSASHLFSREGPPLARSASHASHPRSVQGGQPAPSRRSLSQISIPISALVSPHAPSIARSGTFHMRDPRKPAPVQSTPWTLSFPTHWQAGESKWTLRSWVSRGGSPRHAWLFFIGFVIFPLWWVAALLPIPKTRRIGGTDAEKGVTLDDPQVEHDAKSWRFRCRIMALLSLITYIPFIVLVAIFTRH